jgi:hypothetical protein
MGSNLKDLQKEKGIHFLPVDIHSKGRIRGAPT